MRNKCCKWTVYLITAGAMALAGVVYGQERNAATAQLQWDRCLICHGKPGLKKVLPNGRIISLYVDRDQLARSVHSKRRCEECHTDITTIPHKGEIKKVDCRHCHYKGSPMGVPDTEKYLEYEESVHGRAVKEGNPKAAICQDCHGAHDVLPPTDPASHVFKLHVPQTCGRCHLKEYSDYSKGVHGKQLHEGNMDMPSCVDCHGEHRIYRPTDEKSTVYATHVPETCSKCHAAKQIVGKYGLSPERVETYKESFHGIATEFGEKRAANCASCHGYHAILPSSDPESPIYVTNIPKTCGKCHPNANLNYARGSIHVNPKSKESGVVYYVSTFFRYFTTLVILGLIIHILLDIYRRIRLRLEKEKS